MQLKGIEPLKNLGRVYFAQSISFCLTILMTLYTPKFLGLHQFSYWQLFLLYTSYVGMIQLGLNDGIYLRYGGISLSQRDKSILTGQFFVFVITLIVIFLSIYFTYYICSDSSVLRTLCLLICIYGLISNINGYLIYLLQSTNKIKLYTQALIADKLFLIVAILIIGILNLDNYIIVALLYIIGTVIADCIMVAKSDKAVLTRFKIDRIIYTEIKNNIIAGFPLMLSGIASSLIVGISRFMISDHYPIDTFGIVSLSFTLTVFVLGFISQVGMVIYPLLKNKDISFHKSFFSKVDLLIDLIIPFSFIILPIVIEIINFYLPKYTDAIPYLIMIFPLCLFETRNAILLNTYMKVLRKERLLLGINLLSFIISLFLCYMAIYILNNIFIALVVVTASIIVKSQLMRVSISKHLRINLHTSYNIILTFIYYILCFFCISPFMTVFFMIIIASIILFLNKNKFMEAVAIFIKR